MSAQLKNLPPRRTEVLLSETDRVFLEGKVYVPCRQPLGYLLVRSDKPECQRFVSHAGLRLLLETAAAQVLFRAIAC